MLACERWTLTHSSGWVVGLALAPLPGLETMNASRVAETLADGEVWDDDGEDEPVWEGEPAGELVWDGEPVAELDAGAAADDEPEPDGDGDAGASLGVLVGSVPDDAEAVGEGEPDELEEPEGDGDGDGDGDCDVGVGEGVGVVVAAAGSTTHVVSVFASALAEVPRLAEAAPAVIVPARAEPGQPASTPRVRDPPATRLSTAARTCARRMKTALSPLLIEVTACSLWGS
jgi:hypothetical protein